MPHPHEITDKAAQQHAVSATVKVPTKSLTGPALAWAVAACEAASIGRVIVGMSGGRCAVLLPGGCPYAPDTNRRQGSHILERERIKWINNGRTDRAGRAFRWMATKNFSDPSGSFYGPTALVAGLRCHVASRFGDEVEVPAALLD